MTSAVQTNDPLQGLRVLVVEDETLVAMLIEEYLLELGCVVTASARRVSRALESLASIEVDAAILDLNVAGEDVSPVAEALGARSVPFVLASGYDQSSAAARWLKHPILQKPFTSAELRQALLSALSGAKS